MVLLYWREKWLPSSGFLNCYVLPYTEPKLSRWHFLTKLFTFLNTILYHHHIVDYNSVHIAEPELRHFDIIEIKKLQDDLLLLWWCTKMHSEALQSPHSTGHWKTFCSGILSFVNRMDAAEASIEVHPSNLFSVGFHPSQYFLCLLRLWPCKKLQLCSSVREEIPRIYTFYYLMI